MKRLAPLTLIATAALVLAGCSNDTEATPETDTQNETAQAIEQARAILEEDCDMEGAVNNCTDWLTDLVSATYDAYDTVEEPSAHATERYEYINENSGVYARELECPDTDWLESSCVARHVAIVSDVEDVLNELEQS